MVLGLLRRHPFVATGLVLGSAVALGRSRESRLDPAGWTPPTAPAMSGALAANDELAGLDPVVSVGGPEDVAFDDDGRLYTGAVDGRVYRTADPVDDSTTDATVEVFAHIDGRPLGLTFEGDGDDLLVAGEDAGLLSVAPHGEATALATSAGGQEIAYADDVHVAEDGTVYFTDATVHERFEDELWELRDTGRLLAYHPDTGETTVELDGLGFANGVVPGPAGDSLLVTETSRYRVTRYWVDGERAGEAEPFAENLVGFPDNIDVADDGTYWVAIPSLRADVLDTLHQYPWVVRQLGKLPASATEIDVEPYGLVLRLDEDGDVVESLHDPGGDTFGVTSATTHDGALYLGSLFGSSVRRYPLE
ncbi:SMP-30/gluconolactonase/LRE family protein [Halomarina salina]|uniref:SMP-30/gluconolactonase/LRE family protein n=1 Tax=Halomarina salina TaxID=1872699 RepID=A0ABD5RIM4_9EURY|nr:SMP-30/gluconolactonase/LRE family protein [Halomarina salina]